MKAKDLFILNLKTFIVDLIIFFIGYFLAHESLTLCEISLEGKLCSGLPSYYIGLILILISILHFIVNLVVFIINKLKKKRKKK